MDPYASLATLKSVLDKTTDGDDEALVLALDGATAFINGQTHRRFDRQTLTRTFDAVGGNRIILRDLVSVSSLSYRYYPTGALTLVDTTLYGLGPDVVDDGWPYQWIDLLPGWLADYDIVGGAGGVFPSVRRSVVVAGVWGWPSVPSDIVQVCVSLATRFWKATKAGFDDSIGTDATGQVTFSKSLSSYDRMVLSRYARPVMA